MNNEQRFIFDDVMYRNNKSKWTNSFIHY
jgi:hypothetical protein